MITSLNYSVTFPTNGVSLRGEYNFQPGTTAVTGKNGTGKSFGSIELFRYGLFGQKALRGPASDYKLLDMQLGFIARDAAYQVTRNRKKVELTDAAGEVLAVGADAVNKEIIKVLGFGLDVFDVVCATNQKESERLSQLTPGKRKELIDDVVGLTAQEAVEKACRDEATALRRESEALTRVLVVPTKPDKPKGYRASAVVAKELAAVRETEARRATLQRALEHVGDKPTTPPGEVVDIAALEAHEQERVEVDARRASLRRQIDAIPSTTVTEAELDAAEAWTAYDAEVAQRGPKPSMSASTGRLTDMLDTWDEIAALTKIGETEVHCPKCEHAFRPAQTVPPAPPVSRAALGAELTARTCWDTPLVEPKGERLSRQDIQTGRFALSRVDELLQLSASHAACSFLADRSAELRVGRELNTQWTIYERDLAGYQIRCAAADRAEAERAKLPVPKQSEAVLDAAYVAARVYESQLHEFSTSKARFDELTLEIADKTSRSEAYTAGAKGLVEARRTLKAFLAPSLSRVATALIQQMTNNILNSVVVDEEMNITVDGQDISTLSGAGCTVANLALRLALGQVLVSRVFPVFIGDEIDSDMDPERAQATADALGNLKDQLVQIILISHKRIDNVDQEINLDLAA